MSSLNISSVQCLALWLRPAFVRNTYLQIFTASSPIHSSGILITKEFLRMCRWEHIAIVHSLARLIVRAVLVCFIAARSMNHSASMRILFLGCRFLRCIFFLGSTYHVFRFRVPSDFHLHNFMSSSSLLHATHGRTLSFRFIL